MKLKWIGISLLGLLAISLLLVVGFLWWQMQSGGNPAFFESEILAFEEGDRGDWPPPGGIVFTGSSSIRLWSTLEEDMAPLPVVKRGFGGAHMEHVVHNARRIITPYEPRAVVVFVGGNDIGSGKSALEVAEDFQEFLQIVRGDLPDADVWLLSLKPSRLRWELWPEMKKLDVQLRLFADADPRVHFVETGATLLSESGHDLAWLKATAKVPGSDTTRETRG